MKTMSILLVCLSTSTVMAAEKFAPQVEPLSSEEIGKWIGKVQPSAQIEKSIIRRGLICDQLTMRAYCARYLAHHGDLSDVPYLLDALSDESMHVGASYPYAGMATTRYWANVALVCIARQDLGYRWDDPLKDRKEAIQRWSSFWEGSKHKVNQTLDRNSRVRDNQPDR